MVRRRDDDGVEWYEELGALDGHRLPSARGVGLAELHPLALDLPDPAGLVADEAHGQGQEIEDDTLLLGVLNLLLPSREFLPRTPVHDAYLLSTQTQC